MSNIQYSATSKTSTTLALAAVLLTATSGAPAQEIQPCNSVIMASCNEDAEFVTDVKAADWIEFRNLTQQWRTQRGAQSSVAEMAMLPAYQKIIGMGKSVIPMILMELKSEGSAPDHWFWALAAIAHENPVPPKSRGKMSEMAKAWLEWGQKQGHV
jgi:hypothetical protein